MNDEQLLYDKLKAEVERCVERRMLTPRDFEYLAMKVFDATRQYISATTLKRFWGYLGQVKPRMQTLDVLSMMVGYISWASFCDSLGNDMLVDSNFVFSNNILASMLSEGALVRLYWKPDRCVMVRYNGGEQFEVLESKNSKLSVGDTFFCAQIIENEPLFLRGLVHEGGTSSNYVCGKMGGVKFKIV